MNSWIKGSLAISPIEKEGRKIMFVQYIEQPESSPISGGRIAKEIAKDNLISLTLK